VALQRKFPLPRMRKTCLLLRVAKPSLLLLLELLRVLYVSEVLNE
ncbi:hypothetical protein A2U01_0072330, partial [Trifolium medium]|nr:hypothetical protein [Trifolium medium]